MGARRSRLGKGGLRGRLRRDRGRLGGLLRGARVEEGSEYNGPR